MPPAREFAMPDTVQKPRLRVALCIECSLLQHGGVEVLVQALLPGLAGSMEVFLVSQDPPGGPAPSPATEELAGHFPWDPADRSRGQIDRLIGWGREHRIDLFHFHHGGTYSWNSRSWNHCAITEVSRAGFRCVSTNHGAFGFWLFVGAQRSLPYRLAAMCLCWPAKLRQVASVEWEATVSQHDYHAVRRWFFPVRSRFRQIYHSVLSESTPAPTGEPSRIVLSLATICERKAQDVLAAAFCAVSRKYPDWKLKLVGRIDDAAMALRIKDLAAKAGAAGSVELPGPTDTPWAELEGAAIFAMPSLAEPLGLSLQEGLLAGRACVGSAVGGIPEMIIDEQTGILTPPGNADDLSRALARLMGDENLRKTLGERGRDHILKSGMTREGMVRRHLRLYETRQGGIRLES